MSWKKALYWRTVCDDGSDKDNGDTDDHGDEILNRDKKNAVGIKEGKATSSLSLNSPYTTRGDSC